MELSFAQFYFFFADIYFFRLQQFTFFECHRFYCGQIHWQHYVHVFVCLAVCLYVFIWVCGVCGTFICVDSSSVVSISSTCSAQCAYRCVCSVAPRPWRDFCCLPLATHPLNVQQHCTWRNTLLLTRTTATFAPFSAIFRCCCPLSSHSCCNFLYTLRYLFFPTVTSCTHRFGVGMWQRAKRVYSIRVWLLDVCVCMCKYIYTFIHAFLFLCCHATSLERKYAVALRFPSIATRHVAVLDVCGAFSCARYCRKCVLIYLHTHIHIYVMYLSRSVWVDEICGNDKKARQS